MSILTWLKKFFITGSYYDASGYLQKIPAEVKEKAGGMLDEIKEIAAEGIEEVKEKVEERVADSKRKRSSTTTSTLGGTDGVHKDT